MKRKITLVILVSCMAALVCAGAPADVPATRPDATTRPSTVTLRQWRALRASLFMRSPLVPPPTQQEWDQMMNFLEVNSPARWRVLSTVDLPLNAPVRRDAIRRWRNYNFTREHFPDVADLLIKRIRLEDDLFALTLDAQSSGEMESASIREKIRSKIQEIVQLDFSERQTRIDKLQKMLEQEKSKLAADQATEDKIIEQRTNQIMGRLDRVARDTASPTTRPMTEEADENDAVPTDAPVINLDKAVTPPQK
jgi:hypothetical protein